MPGKLTTIPASADIVLRRDFQISLLVKVSHNQTFLLGGEGAAPVEETTVFVNVRFYAA